MMEGSPSIKDVFDSLRTDGNTFVDFEVLSSKLIEYFGTGDPIEDQYIEDILKSSLNVNDGKIYYEEFYKCFCSIINQQNQNSSRRQSVTSFIEDEIPHSEHNTNYNSLNEECFEYGNNIERRNSQLNSNSFNVSASRQARALLSTEDSADNVTHYREESEFHALEHQVDDLNHKIDQLTNENNYLTDKIKEFEERELREKEENQKLIEKIIVLEEQMRENESNFKEELLTAEKEADRKLNKLTQHHDAEIDNYQVKLENLTGKCDQLSSQLIKKEDEFQDKLKSTIEQHRFDQDALRERLNEESAKIIEDLQDEREEALEKINELELSFLAIENDGKTESLNESVSKRNSMDYSRRDSSISAYSRNRSASRVFSMTAELEELVQKLSAENRELKEEINDYKLEVAALRITEGEPRPEVRLRSETATETFAQELETYGMQQLKEALSNEKETVSKLQDYINNLLMRIVENYPKLLELI